jgi:PAS domain-containing protein
MPGPVSAVDSTGVRNNAGTSNAAPAAVALLDADGTVRRATGLFQWHYGEEHSRSSIRPEIARVATGELDTANVTMSDGADAEIAAAVSSGGERCALLTVWRDEPDHAADDKPSALVDEPIDESPAIVWLKDLEGRYLRVNRRYTDQMRTTSDELLGQTDAELSPSASIEAPRLQANPAAQKEPLELEYTVAAYQQRPAFAVLRFALRDQDGQPTAVCSVAAPQPDAQIARSECERLMRVERWGRSATWAIRDELLDDWGVELAASDADRSAEMPPLDSVVPAAEASAAIAAERDAALAEAARVEEELSTERQQLADAKINLDTLSAELENARGRLRNTETELQRARAEQDAQRDQAEAAIAEERQATEALRAELQTAQEALRFTTPETGPRWDASSQRALSGALAGITEWRAGLKHVVKSLGVDGGWDTVVAWCPEDRRGFMKCVAMWTDGSPNLSALETRTWQHRQDVGGTEFGRARNRSGATCLLELPTAEDSLLRAAAAEGMSSAVLVPIQNGSETIGMLELLSRSEVPPNGELTLFLEGVGLQLAALAQMLNFAAVPRWTVGRM